MRKEREKERRKEGKKERKKERKKARKIAIQAIKKSKQDRLNKDASERLDEDRLASFDCWLLVVDRLQLYWP